MAVAKFLCVDQSKHVLHVVNVLVIFLGGGRDLMAHAGRKSVYCFILGRRGFEMNRHVTWEFVCFVLAN